MNKPNNGVWLNRYSKNPPEFDDTLLNFKGVGSKFWHKHMWYVDVLWIVFLPSLVLWLCIIGACFFVGNGEISDLASLVAGFVFSALLWAGPSIVSENTQRDLNTLGVEIEIVDLLIQKLDSLILQEALFSKADLQCLLSVCDCIGLYMSDDGKKCLVTCCNKTNSEGICTIANFSCCLRQLIDDKSFSCDAKLFDNVVANSKRLRSELSCLRDKLLKIKAYIVCCYKPK